MRRRSLFFFSSRRRHTRFKCDWSSDVCSSDLRQWRPRDGARLPLIPLLPEMPVPVLGLLLVPPLELVPPRAPPEPPPTFATPPGFVLAKLWLPLAKPPLLEAAVPPPVPAAWPEVAFAAPLAP